MVKVMKKAMKSASSSSSTMKKSLALQEMRLKKAMGKRKLMMMSALKKRKNRFKAPMTGIGGEPLTFHEYGPEYVTVKVTIPKSPSGEEKKLVEQISEL